MIFNEIIYDFDGTVSDTYPVFAEAMLRVLENHGIRAEYDEVYANLKVTVGYAINRYFGEGENREIHREFAAVHRELAPARQKPIAGAAEILEYTIARGGRNYIFTHSGEIVRFLLTQWGLIDYFTDIVDGSIKLNRKPAPDGVLYLIERNGIDPDRAVIVGDRDIDLLAGFAAGIEGCLFDVEHYYDGFECKYRVNSLTELKTVFGE